MAIAFDAATDGGNNGGTTSTLTFSHTVTGSNPILHVGVVGGTGAGGNEFTVTYNGVSMSFVANAEGGPFARDIDLFELAAPATGANNVVVTKTGGSGYIEAYAVSHTGAKQSAQPDNSTTNSSSGGTVASITATLTTVADRCWTVAFARVGQLAATPWTNGTARVTNGGSGFADSAADITPAGSTSMTANDNTTAVSAIIMVSIAPATGGGGGATITTATIQIAPVGFA